jgi:hypothetical protein
LTATAAVATAAAAARWLRHVERMPEEITAKKMFKNIPEGKMSVGKPRKECLDMLKMIRRKWVLEAGEK